MGKTSKLPVFLNRAAHPVDLGITTDSLVEGIDHDHLNIYIKHATKITINLKHGEF